MTASSGLRISNPAGSGSDQGNVNAAGGCRHCQLDAHARAGADVPHAVLVAPYIGRIVDSLIDSLDGEAMIGGVQAQVEGRIAAGPAGSRAVPGLPFCRTRGRSPSVPYALAWRNCIGRSRLTFSVERPSKAWPPA